MCWLGNWLSWVTCRDCSYKLELALKCSTYRWMTYTGGMYFISCRIWDRFLLQAVWNGYTPEEHEVLDLEGICDEYDFIPNYIIPPTKAADWSPAMKDFMIDACRAHLRNDKRKLLGCKRLFKKIWSTSWGSAASRQVTHYSQMP